MIFRETKTSYGLRQFIDGRRVSNHEFSQLWLAALGREEINREPTKTYDRGRVLLWVTEGLHE